VKGFPLNFLKVIYMTTDTATIKNKGIFSEDKQHRYLLRREWDKTKKSALILMINPTTSDINTIDTTTMLVLNNMISLGFGSVNIANLYTRITPKLNFRFNSDEDLLDLEGDKILEQYAAMSDAIIIAWGSIGKNNQRVKTRIDDIMSRIEQFKNKMYQIGEHGYHPLTPSVRKWELVPYVPEEKAEHLTAENKGGDKHA